MSGWIGITVGDVTGIGPEVTLKAVAAEIGADDTRYLLIGDVAWLKRLHAQLHCEFPLQNYEGSNSAGRVFVVDPRADPLPGALPAGAPAAACAALAWLTEGANRCLQNSVDALVTAPVNKEAVLRAGHAFIGQTEFLSNLAGTERTAMMLLGEDGHGRWLRVALATTHLPLRAVADHLDQSKIELVIELAARACNDLGLERARIAVCGLNPHAGEGGLLGDEESKVIAPAVRAAQKRGLQVAGPLAADTLFYHAYRGDYDAVVAMYHDQGLVPLKMIGFETGVNWTLGLPFIRTSPDHGTAYDIAGRGVANPASLLAAIHLAKKLARSRT
jgi:4-hydroxythreonine-4-phosphate dehydrogenase